MNIAIHMGMGFPKGSACANRMRVFYEVFKSKGHNVKVLTPEDMGVSDGIDSEDVFVCKTYKMKKKTATSRLKNNLSFAINSIRASRIIGDIDIVITTSPPPLISLSGWWIAKRKKAKLVYDVRDIWPDVAIEMGSFSEKSVYYHVFKWIAQFMYKHSDLVLTVSNGKVKKIQGYVEDKNKVVLCANGLDEKFLDHTVDDGVVERYNMKDYFNCVYVGNIGLAQGLEQLLVLAEKIQNKKVQFLLFGEGAEKEKLETVKEEKKLCNVHFFGNVYEKEVFNVLRNAQLSYIPLVNENLRDSIPTKTYEALGVGCPVLMVAEGDAVSLVEESKLGWSISPAKIDELPVLFGKIIDEYENARKNKEFSISITKTKHSRQKIIEGIAEELVRVVKKDEQYKVVF